MQSYAAKFYPVFPSSWSSGKQSLERNQTRQEVGNKIKKYSLNHTDTGSSPASARVMVLRGKSSRGGPFVPRSLALDCLGCLGLRNEGRKEGKGAGRWEAGRTGERWRALTLFSSPPHLIWLEVIERTAVPQRSSNHSGPKHPSHRE